MTTLDILKAARALIADPARWTTGMTARDSAGVRCLSKTDLAVVWSIAGALNRSADTADAYRCAAETLEQAMPFPFTSVEEYNDLHTHAEVLTFLDTEITRLESAVQA